MGDRHYGLWGKDYTKQSMDEDSPTDHWEEIELPYVRTLFSNQAIGVCGGSLHVYNRDFVRVSYIDLPLTHKDDVMQILSIYVRDDNPQSLVGAPLIYEFLEMA